MGLWDFVKSAGKALGIGDAEAAEAPPAPEALKKEVEDLGLKADGLDITVEGDTVKVTGKARDPGGEGEDHPRGRQRRGRRQGRGDAGDARAGGASRCSTPSSRATRCGRSPRRPSARARATRRSSRRTGRCCQRPGQDLPGPGAAHPGEVADAAAALALPEPRRYRRCKGPNRPPAREDAWSGSRRWPTSGGRGGDALGGALAARTLYEQLTTTAGAVSRPAGAQLPAASGPRDKVGHADLGRALKAEVTQAANLFRRLGVGPSDTVAYVLPNGDRGAGGAARRRDRRDRRADQPAALGRAYGRASCATPARRWW